MSLHQNVDYYEFPLQSEKVGELIDVIVLDRSGESTVNGIIIRDDILNPLVTIAHLENGMVVIGDELFDGFREPNQDVFRNHRMRVKLNNSKSVLDGVILRNDFERSGYTVIKLDVGRIVLGSECYFSRIGRKKPMEVPELDI